jgi:hypothetical protein
MLTNDMDFEPLPGYFNHELVLAFFWKFSRFEGALKHQGFRKKRLYDDGVEPDWKAFERRYKRNFSRISTSDFKKAVLELIRLAPKRQVLTDEGLDWKPVARDGAPDELYAFRLLKTVRNNLFHGGKYEGYAVSELARDEKLLYAALKVLEGCAQLHSGIHNWMQEAA